MELAGQAAIVTGGGRGIGRAVALELAGLGADVVVAELDAATGERTAEEVRGLGRRAVALRTDVRQRADLEEMVRRTLDELGRVDILVNNAAVAKGDDILEIDEATWDLKVRVVLNSVFLC